LDVGYAFDLDMVGNSWKFGGLGREI